MNIRAALRTIVLGGSLVFASFTSASTPQELPLWQGTAPGGEGSAKVSETAEQRGTAEKPNRFVRGVTVPTITVYRPPLSSNTGTAVLILPGGGYSGLAIDKEGHEIARYLNTIGVTGVVLKYRLPRPQGFVFEHDVPLTDAARAMRLVRHHADQWGLDQEKIGIMGFSAGGHLAATVATQHERGRVDPSDLVDRQASRADFQALIYPVITFDEEISHGGSRRNLIGKEPAAGLADLYSNELHVNEVTPPAFLVSTSDDRVKAENSLLYFKALRAAGVPVELHIYEVGGHGYGINPSENPVSTWHHRFSEWLGQRGLLDR